MPTAIPHIHPTKVSVFTGVLSSLGLSVANNLFADQVKIGILDAGLMKELAPLLGLFLVPFSFGPDLDYIAGR